ncbi:hypothetical protein OSTOST_19688 [Ostertagia ostertagi]
MSDLSATVPYSTIILGDFNLDIDWKSGVASSAGAQKFLAAFENLSLQQWVTFPTREDRTLDLILSNEHCIANPTPHAPLSTSDHNIVSFRISTFRFDTELVSYRDFKCANKEKIEQILSNFDWMRYFDNYLDIDEVYGRFTAVLLDIINRYIPLRQYVKHSSGRYPTHIRNLFEQRERLFQQLFQPSQNALFLDISKKLDFHVKRFLAFRMRKLAKNEMTPLEIHFPNKIPLRHSEQIKDLGIKLSKNLSWSIHVDEVSNRALRLVHLLFRNIHGVNVDMWIRLFKSYILPMYPPGSAVALHQVNKKPPYLYQLCPGVIPPLSYGEMYSSKPIVETIVY